MSKRLRRGSISWLHYADANYEDDLSIPPFWCVMAFQDGLIMPSIVGDKRRPTSRIGGRG